MLIKAANVGGMFCPPVLFMSIMMSEFDTVVDSTSIGRFCGFYIASSSFGAVEVVWLLLGLGGIKRIGHCIDVEG
ncbi:hypothetical protein MLD38_039395 [Melastoma candidum]|uniref:Uncharacterized protein n=1 Tax=Melastoma candidum TaxID=119954 RepID=A0ACB9L353_9MYRT|nr:hypothetical protein MLD38_039395 [Melastoma candidum]